MKSVRISDYAPITCLYLLTKACYWIIRLGYFSRHSRSTVQSTIYIGGLNGWTKKLVEKLAILVCFTSRYIYRRFVKQTKILSRVTKGKNGTEKTTALFLPSHAVGWQPVFLHKKSSHSDWSESKCRARGGFISGFSCHSRYKCLSWRVCHWACDRWGRTTRHPHCQLWIVNCELK